MYARFKDNITCIKYLLCVIDVFTKYAWIKPSKDKKTKTVPNGFAEIVNEPKCKLWVVQGREFYNSLVQKWLDDNGILMYWTHNEGKSVVAERLIKTLKGKSYNNKTANKGKSYLGHLNK